MNLFMLDASVFLARYTLGPGYQHVDQLFAHADQGRLCCSILSLAEVAAAFMKLRRRGRLTPVLFAGAHLQFRLDVIESTAFTKVPLLTPQVEASLSLIEKHRLDGLAGIFLRVCLDHAVLLRAASHSLVLVSSVRSAGFSPSGDG